MRVFFVFDIIYTFCFIGHIQIPNMMSQCQKDKMGVGLDLGGRASGTVTIEADSVAPCEFLPPANVVCEGYVFTPVCDSVNRGACVVAPGGRAWLLLGGGMHGEGGCAW